MSKVAVVYWSGTGNTERMALQVKEGAQAAGAQVTSSGTGNTERMALQVKEGAQAAGAQVTSFTATKFSSDLMDSFDAIAFGCPSMGAEVLEETEFEPMFSDCETKLKGKKIALFGSYGWGDGEWMRNWEETCRKDGAYLVCDCVICNEEPDEQANEACRSMGKDLAQ